MRRRRPRRRHARPPPAAPPGAGRRPPSLARRHARPPRRARRSRCRRRRRAARPPRTCARSGTSPQPAGRRPRSAEHRRASAASAASSVRAERHQPGQSRAQANTRCLPCSMMTVVGNGASRSRTYPEGMQYRTMGSSDLTVSALGFGCWEMGGNQYGEVDDEEERRAVQRAIDLGVTLFDTAAVYGYGHSEEVLGRALGSRRSEIVLVTKGGLTWEEVGGPITRTATREVLVSGLEDSLRRLGTDYVDLFLIHWPDGKTPEADMMASLNELRAVGQDALRRRVELHRRHAAGEQAGGGHLRQPGRLQPVRPSLGTPDVPDRARAGHRHHGLRPDGAWPADRHVYRRHELPRLGLALARAGLRAGAVHARELSAKRGRGRPVEGRRERGSARRCPSWPSPGCCRTRR